VETEGIGRIAESAGQTKYRHRVVAWWTSGQTGLAKSDSAPNAIHFTAPREFGGLEGRWTPEDLLLCAVASCFTTTFQTLAEYVEFHYNDLEVEAEGLVKKEDSGYGFSRMVLHIKLTVGREEDRKQAQGLLQKARALCLVSRALVVKPEFEDRVTVSGHVATA
jgi:organic hydroperoxide reductase OsmC/OhrA